MRESRLDGDDVIAEYAASGTLQKEYVLGPNIDEPILMKKGARKYYYHYDGLGSVTALTDENGTVVEEYTYDAYGQVSGERTVGNPYYFTGRRLDEETGIYYYRARMYDPQLGRFLQRDPIGYYDSMNLYQYVGNNSLNWNDPYGLKVGPLGPSYSDVILPLLLDLERYNQQKKWARLNRKVNRIQRKLNNSNSSYNKKMRNLKQVEDMLNNTCLSTGTRGAMREIEDNISQDLIDLQNQINDLNNQLNRTNKLLQPIDIRIREIDDIFNPRPTS